MPQYDAYEEPLALDKSRNDMQTSQPTPPSQPQPKTPIQNTGIYTIHPENNDPFHSAMSAHTHARHSSLARQDPNTTLVPRTLTHPHSSDPSPKTLEPEELASLAAYTKAQFDNDSIRLALACERCGEDLNAKDASNNPEEFAKEAHMLNGGWMHRSRASCEMLSEREAGETWEVKEGSRGRGAL